MIIGIGTDIIEIDRIENAINKTNGFIDKLFTKREIEMFKSRNMRAEVVAGNFAAKEAISKAFGTGIRGFSLKEIEVLRDKLGKPEVFLSDNINSLIGKKYNINISISHNNTSSIAFAILEEA
ncbi:holo-ACP synthase [Clostridium sp. MB05]|jgi:holo-[acyl-carrier protein] synthase|uniref:holo-ACP synthase n=1 Tax=Clostridium sp. MB05 TaxID=3376682 RepID=UPI00398252C0